MEVKKLYEMVDEDQKEGSLGEKAYWKDLWECYIEEKSMDYASLSVKEAIPRLVSEQNLRERRHAGSCGELGVDIRVGDICYIDFGEAYIAVSGVIISNKNTPTHISGSWQLGRRYDTDFYGGVKYLCCHTYIISHFNYKCKIIIKYEIFIAKPYL